MNKEEFYLVTGGAGFIGSHIVERLIKENKRVIVIDNLSSGTYDNIKPFENRNLIFYKEDITNEKVLNSIIKDYKISIVFHQAALSNVPQSVENPKLTFEINVKGTLNLLLLCKKYKINKFIYASSSSVYGDNLNLPLKEEYLPNPLSPYALSKLEGEYWCKLFNSLYNIQTICLRYFNVYGPRQKGDSPYSGVISKFIEYLKKDIAPPIYGDGNQTRDFIYVEDIVQANILASLKSEININNKVFNIGTGNPISINELYNILSTLLNKSNIKPIYSSPRIGDIKYSYADINLATKYLKFSPCFNINQGLKKLINTLK